MFRYPFYWLALLLVTSIPATARVRLPAIFSDGMVLQQKTQTAFWGWADPGEAVTIRVSWAAAPVSVHADASGRWKAAVPTPIAGGPYKVHINDIVLKDVYSGEVWLCSGQSNMVFSMKETADHEAEIAKADYPTIRYFSVTRQYARHDFEDAPGAHWVLCSPKTAPGFSAVAYFFARKLQQTLHVPVGIVYSAWGGTPAEAWTPETILAGDPVLARYDQRWKAIQQNVGADSTKYHAEIAAGKKAAEPQTFYYFKRPWREPGVLYNGMIEPVIPFTLKGVLWYQGESNVNYADEYYRLLSSMIAGWRHAWQQPDLPFYVVQISAFGYASPDNAAKVREAEYEISQRIPHTGTAVTLDLGDMKNIHYTHKQPVGERLARIALHNDYGFSTLDYRGPEFASAVLKAGEVTISFRPSASKLAGDTVGGFELGVPSGDSLLYSPARAQVQGDKVVVWKEGVDHPAAVRYGWGLPAQANLFDSEGLPAFPFKARLGSGSAGSSGGAGGGEQNLALGKPVSANSANPHYPASNVVDGKITRESKWQSGNITPPHILEINLQRYCNIDRVVVHTGIPESERTAAESSQAAGFWSAKNFKLQYWDDANWTDIPNTEVHENRLTDVPYTFASPVNTFKLRFVCDDGEPINVMEIEVFGKQTSNIPVAGSGAADLLQKADRTADQNLTIRLGDSVIGKTMRYVAYNQGYYVPGGNTSGWLEYSGVNSLRVWTTLNSYVPESDVQVDPTLTTVAEFDRRKQQLRASPEKNEFLHWERLLPLYEHPEQGPNTNPMILSYCLSELKRLHIDPVIQAGSTDFDSSWSNKWKQWQRYYVLAFYCARAGDVTMFAMTNEPNHKNAGPMKLDQWIGGMQIVSDAITCAIEDVDRLYGKHLKARMVGPVTAGNNTEWWRAVAKAQRTDYHGKPLDHDLLGIFSTHSYNSPAAGYVHRVDDIRQLLQENQPGGKALPIVYTEIGRWMNAYLIDKEETMDDPSLFTEWAGIYANNTLNGAYGMWAFKFANTTSSTYPFGIKSGHHFSWPGRRIVEDAYTDLALGRPVKASTTSGQWPASNVTDGVKTDYSAWQSDSSQGEKWLEIDLGKEQSLGSGVVYTGGAHGDYTSPTRVRNFSLQYFTGGGWQDIPGFTLKNNKYAQVFIVFKTPVTTRRIRFHSTDPGPIRVREIKVFAKGDGPGNTPDYDVSGIQRTGEVVRLFAKGFKDERPLLATHVDGSDDNLHVLMSYDAATRNYYCWLVQRGKYTDHLTLDLSALPVQPGTPVTAETVGPTTYGEVAGVYPVGAGRKLTIPLGGQTVMLLSIPVGHLTRTVMPAVAESSVSPKATQTRLEIALDASKPEMNKVSYIRFDESKARAGSASRILLKVHGSNVTDTAVYRFHVYGLPTGAWQKLTWQSAPQLDAKEALIKNVGRDAFVAGELAMDHTPKDHWLDVTDLVKRHAGTSITFALVRETRHTGDDADKGRTVVIDKKPELLYWK
ncbi:discoidin domain-containing protein [Puia sp.]|uniref:discoidin domain-containing protein n=1 Tax=Puia sp. TaxID=2045100 RepID=UPI002F415296